MKNIGITGSWRTVNEAVHNDVRQVVRDIVGQGDRIITGGALGVDWIATDEAMKQDSSYRGIQVIIPTSLSIYSAHYFRRATEGVISIETALGLLKQLQVLKEHGCLEEMEFLSCNPETYFTRNQRVVDKSDALVAFHVNNSGGVQDTIYRALAKKIDIKVYSYVI